MKCGRKASLSESSTHRHPVIVISRSSGTEARAFPNLSYSFLVSPETLGHVKEKDSSFEREALAVTAAMKLASAGLPYLMWYIPCIPTLNRFNDGRAPIMWAMALGTLPSSRKPNLSICKSTSKSFVGASLIRSLANLTTLAPSSSLLFARILSFKICKLGNRSNIAISCTSFCAPSGTTERSRTFGSSDFRVSISFSTPSSIQ